MGKESKPKKKLSMKTRLLVILVVFVIMNVIFYVAFDDKDDSQENKETIQEDQAIPDEPPQEELFDKFNPPKP